LTLILAIVALPASVSGCGGGAKDEARELRAQSIISDPQPVSATVLTAKDLAHYKAGSVERAFSEYWSALQFEAWRTAASYYEPTLRTYIGDDLLLPALEGQAGIFLSNRPVISQVEHLNGETLVKYILRDTGKNETTRSMAWRRVQGKWRIVYDAFLDRALAESRQLEVQAQVDPVAQKPSPEALRAAGQARRLQSKFWAQAQAP